MKNLIVSVRLLVVLSLLTGLVYPLSLVVVGFAFPWQARGSILVRDGQPVGSALLAQKNESARYFQPRPSAADYATVASGASNLGPTSAALAKAISDRRSVWGPTAPEDLLTTSGSGLDPHLSPAAATFQAARVAQARAIPVQDVEALVRKFTDPPQFGFLGEPRVRILEINLALDDLGKP